MGLFEWLLRPRPASPRDVMDRTERLRHQGRSAEAVRLVEAAAGIEPADYEEPARLLQKLRRWLASSDPRVAYTFIGHWCTILADTPGPEDRLALAARIWELDTGLAPQDYFDPQRIRDRIRERIESDGFDPRLAILHAGRLAAALGVAGRTNEEVAVLEAILGLRREDYSDPVRLARILRLEAEGEFPDLRAFCVPTLSGALGKQGRRVEGTAIMIAALGLTEQELTAPARILARVREIAQEPHLSMYFLTSLPLAVREAGGGRAGLTALEIDLDPDPERYRDLAHLAARLRGRLRGFPPDITFFYLQSLVVGLTDEGRIDHALALLAADAGFSASDLVHPQRLSACLKRRYQVLPANIGAFYIWLVAYVLVLAGLPLAAAAVIEMDAALEAVDWNDSAALAMVLEARFAGFSVISPLFLVDQLASALAEGGRSDRAALLVDAYVRGLSPAGGADEEISLVRWRCQMYARWLLWWGQDESRCPMEICHALLPYLRRSMAGRGSTLQDREDFIREVGELRRRIVQTGLYWAARETNAEQARELRRTVLLWDLELAQRLLLERFLLTEIRAVPAGKPLPAGVWPLTEEPPAAAEYLPDFQETLAAAGALT